MSSIVHPEGWPRPRGYANGVKARGETVFVAGQVGWNTRGEMVAADMAGQVRQALENVCAVLAAAGAEAEHVVRMTWYVTDLDAYRAQQSEIGEAYRAVMGAHYPAMTLVQVAGLVEEGAKVEIEATAVVPEA
ncbi:MAG: RidA family protein [Candidatus Krumholzibacteria bacterium]|nr:RidA family protein [Candidatus Krumholzibacteria bacterium]